MMLVNLIGLSLIGLIVWWFWIKKPPSLKASSNVIEIIVEMVFIRLRVLKLTLARKSAYLFYEKTLHHAQKKLFLMS